MTRSKTTRARANLDQGDASPADVQRGQAELLDRAMKMPGVAEAMDAYARFEPHVTTAGSALLIVRHATGGNG